MTSAQKKRIKAVWHDDHLKIAYPSDPGILSVVYDREISCPSRPERWAAKAVLDRPPQDR